MSVALASKIRAMEKRAHVRLKRHVEGKNSINWLSNSKYSNQEEEYRTEVRLWTRIALTATALSPTKKGGGEHVKAEKSEKGVTKKSGSTQGSSSSSSSSPLLSLVQVPAKLAINLSIHTQHTYDNGVDRTGDRVFRKIQLFT